MSIIKLSEKHESVFPPPFFVLLEPDGSMVNVFENFGKLPCHYVVTFAVMAASLPSRPCGPRRRSNEHARKNTLAPPPVFQENGGGAVGVGAAGTVVRSANPNESSSRI
jgi:hypothetical protein